jgi:hypothetical protein
MAKLAPPFITIFLVVNLSISINGRALQAIYRLMILAKQKVFSSCRVYSLKFAAFG